MIETSLRDNVKIVITENGISPLLLLDSLPVTVASEKNGRKTTSIRKQEKFPINKQTQPKGKLNDGRAKI